MDKMNSDLEHSSPKVTAISCQSHESKRSRRSLFDSEDILPIVKFILIVGLAVSIVAIAFQNPNDVLRSRRQFRSWYSQYVYQFEIISRDYCGDAYSIYLYGTRKNTTEVTLSGSGEFTLFVQPMVECILNNTSEYIKYQMSGSQVMLGLTPTILALLGASSEEVCLLALIGRRRLLALLLACASPSIYTERAFKYQDPDKILKERLNRAPGGIGHVVPTMAPSLRPFFVSAEYFAVFGAIANVAILNWQLGTKSITAMNLNTVLMPLLWSLLGVLAHLAGAVVFDMRARRLDKQDTPLPQSTPRSVFAALRKRKPWPVIKNFPAAAKKLAVREFCLRNYGPRSKLYFDLIPERRWFTILAWFLSVLTIFILILGTLILASTTLVGPKDALGIMSRYILSVVVCRIILVYELAVLRVEYKNATATS